MTVDEVRRLWDKHMLWLVRDGHGGDLGQATLNNQQRGRLLLAWKQVVDVEKLYLTIAAQGYCDGEAEKVKEFTLHLARGEEKIRIDLMKFLELGHSFAGKKKQSSWKELYDRCLKGGVSAIYVREDQVRLSDFGLSATSQLFLELGGGWVETVKLLAFLVAEVKQAELLEDGYTLCCFF